MSKKHGIITKQSKDEILSHLQEKLDELQMDAKAIRKDLDAKESEITKVKNAISVFQGLSVETSEVISKDQSTSPRASNVDGKGAGSKHDSLTHLFDDTEKLRSELLKYLKEMGSSPFQPRVAVRDFLSDRNFPTDKKVTDRFEYHIKRMLKENLLVKSGSKTKGRWLEVAQK